MSPILAYLQKISLQIESQSDLHTFLEMLEEVPELFGFSSAARTGIAQLEVSILLDTMMEKSALLPP